MGNHQGVATRLAEIALEASERVDDQNVSAAVKNAVIDWMAGTIGGSRTHVARALRAGVAAHEMGPARLVGMGDVRTSAPTAAFINGTAAHALEVDDIYAPGFYHPSAPTVAAALAVADLAQVDGPALMRGVLAGVEVGCRVAEDLGPMHYRFWHTTGTVGAIGAAVAASVVLRLNTDQIAHAMTLAATMAGGLQQSFRSGGEGKPMHSGHAAQVGVISALAASEHLGGAWDVLEGEVGLAQATGVTTEWEASTVALSQTLKIEQLTVKPYPCCGHTFAVADSMFTLLRDRFDPDEVHRVEIGTYRAATEVANIARPTSAAEAQFSMGFVAAVSLLDGHLDAASFDEARLRDPRVLQLMERVEVHIDAALDRQAPEKRGAQVRLHMSDGTIRTAVTPDRFGSPSNPLTEAAFETKYTSLVEPVIGEQHSSALLTSMRALEQCEGIDKLFVNQHGN